MFVSFVAGQEISTLVRDPRRLIAAAKILVTAGVLPYVTVKFRHPGDEDRDIYRIYHAQGGAVVEEKSDDAEELIEQYVALEQALTHRDALHGAAA